MDKNQKRNFRVAERFIALLVAVVILVSSVPNEMFSGIFTVEAKKSEQTEKKSKSDHTEPEVKQIQLEPEAESEQSDESILLMEEEQRILEEDSVNESRFIVKYRNPDKRKTEKLKKASKKVYKQLKKQKDQEEAEREKLLEDVDPERLEDFQMRMEILRPEQEDVPELYIEEIEENNFKGDIIQLEDRIDPEDFMLQVALEMGDQIAYIQPDYVLELAGEVTESEEEVTVDSEEESVETESETETEEPETESEVETEAEAPDADEDEPETEAKPKKKKSKSESEDPLYNLEADLEEAWKVSRGEGVTVALIDTGVDVSHPMLENHITEGYDFYNNSSEVYNPELGMGQTHGTHIAGIIAQSAPDAKIMPLKVFEKGKAYTSDIIRAIEYAEENGVSVVNMSFGSTDDNQFLKEAMEESRLFFVCAAGNNRMNIDDDPIYPAAFGLENSISVAALNDDLGMSYFSNYGVENVDIAAWGRDVYSAFPDGEYGTMDGTSMSAAYVTAAAAFVSSNDGIENLKEELKDTSDKLSCLERKVDSGNKVSFAKAVNSIQEKEVIAVNPEDDWDVFGYQRTPEENWALFSDSPAVEVAAGNHTMVLREDGTVWTWGYNEHGQLGDGPTINRNVPAQAIGLDNIIAISASITHSMALRGDGTVWTWGNNGYGQLGDGTTTHRYIPVKSLTAYDGVETTAISAGDSFSIALKEDGTVWTWGNNDYGQLGNGTSNVNIYPSEVEGLGNIKAISAGYTNGMALSQYGGVSGWGYGRFGNVGDAGGVTRYSPVSVAQSVPRAKAISMGAYHSLVLTEDEANVWAWGTGYIGDEGTGTRYWPQQVENLGYIDQLCAGKSNSIAIGGTTYVWGDNSYGQLGDGTTTPRHTPVRNWFIDRIQSVDMGEYHTVAVRQDGTVWTWGRNNYGQLGDGGTSSQGFVKLNV